MLKVSNLVDPDSARLLHKANYEKVAADVQQEVARHAEPRACLVTTLNSACIGAEPGSLFFELQSEKDAESVIKALNGRVYERREMKICCVPLDTYHKHIKPALTGAAPP